MSFPKEYVLSKLAVQSDDVDQKLNAVASKKPRVIWANITSEFLLKMIDTDGNMRLNIILIRIEALL